MRVTTIHTSCLGYSFRTVKTILSPITAGFGAARHVAWYLSYQLTGEARTSDQS